MMEIYHGNLYSQAGIEEKKGGVQKGFDACSQQKTGRMLVCIGHGKERRHGAPSGFGF
jgi:hypothetical protein